MSAEMMLEGKVVVITGASRGIGRALALGFAKEGAVVVAAARTLMPGTGPADGSLTDTAHQITEAGGKALAVPCDVALEADVKKLAECVLAEVGPIDVLINNAGISRYGPVTQFSVEDFDMVMAVNARGPFLMCKHFLSGMMERRQGNVINISSRMATWYDEDSMVYGPSKAALDQFTMNLAMDMKPYNIAVNALSPGLIATSQSRYEDQSENKWGITPDPPEAVVPAALWLAQQDASSFTGRLVLRDDFGKTWP